MKFEELDLSKTYTYADYLTWKLDEYVELIKGKVFRMTPAPTKTHQIISSNILSEIGHYLKGQKCKAFHAPFDVRLPNKRKSTEKEIISVVQPDICVVCDPTKLDERGCLGAPDLIVEILSVSTQKKDHDEKYHLYEENGVKEYWIVSPSDKSISVYELKHKKFELRENIDAVFNTKDVQVGIFPELILKYDDIFNM